MRDRAPNSEQEAVEHGLPLRLSLLPQDECVAAALDTCARKEPPRLGTDEVVAYRCAARALTDEEDPRWIATKCRDVVLHPAQRKPLVLDAVRARAPFWVLESKDSPCQEAKDIESVVEADNDEVSIKRRIERAVQATLVTPAVLIASTVHPHKHGHRGIRCRLWWCEDIQEETVLTHLGVLLKWQAALILEAVRTECSRIQNIRCPR